MVSLDQCSNAPKILFNLNVTSKLVLKSKASVSSHFGWMSLHLRGGSGVNGMKKVFMPNVNIRIERNKTGQD
jgi:hypothetical protein